MGASTKTTARPGQPAPSPTTSLLSKLPQARRLAARLVLPAAVLALGACGAAPTPAPTALPTAVVVAPTAAPAPTVAPAPTARGPMPIVEIVEAMRQSVVLVRAEFPETVFSEAGGGAGTGIVLEDGYIVTNAHVVQGASSLTIALEGNTRERPAKIVGVSACDDLAVLRVDNSDDLVPATLGESADLSVGEEVLAMGFPESWQTGDDISATRGIISKKNVALGTYDQLLQTDAAINPGNSGGPLLSMYGAVIGINTLKISDENTSGVNFAISIDQARPIIESLREGTNREWHGMNLRSVQLDDGRVVLVVDAVQSGSPADKAGVLPADILLKLEGSEVAYRSDVCRVVRSRNDGDTLKVELWRSTADEHQFLRGSFTLGGAADSDGIEVVNREPREQGGQGGQGEAGQGGGGGEASADQPGSAVVTGGFGEAQILAARELYDSYRGRARQLLFETFDQGNTTRGRWLDGAESQTESQAALLRGNLYELVVKQPDLLTRQVWYEGGQPRSVGGNYIIELDIALPNGPTSSAGIVFAGRDGANDAYFVAHGDGTWQLFTFLDGSAENAYTTGAIRSEALIGGGNVNQLRVMKVGGDLWLYINHTPVGMVQGFPLDGGYLGVMALASDGPLPISVLTDNFRVLQVQ